MKFQKRFSPLLFLPVFCFLALLPETAPAQLLTGYSNPEYEAAPSGHFLTAQGQESASAQPQQEKKSKIDRFAENYSNVDEKQPVDLAADSLTHDETTQTITAKGNVELIQAGRTLRADMVSYDMRTDTVTAKGNIVLHEANGDVHFADEVRLADKMREGFVHSLRSYLADGGLFTAESGERKDGGHIFVMKNASYTPCDCEEDKEGNPAWALKAKEVTYDELAHDVKYKNARFEIFGVPVAWTPYFIHSDGKVKRQSGFLTPRFGYDSRLGFVVTPRYYWDIAPDKDATISVMATSKEPPVLLGEYRQRFAQASLEMDGSVGYSGRTESDDGLDVHEDEELRGHLFSRARWDINNKWRAGLDIELTSDDQYLNQFDISGKDLLENELFVERFSGRNYAVARALSFQDLRIRTETLERDQPDILPEVIASFYGEPNQTFGGRWSFEATALGLNRYNNQQDMNRLTAEADWQRRFTTNFGLVATQDFLVRGDLYQVNDRDVALPGSGRSSSGSDVRGFAQSHTVVSYPLVKQMERAQAVIEPVAALTLAPNTKAADSNIPNEDSQDVQIDTSNLFEANRFAGKDRIEDKSRITYGLRSGVYGHDGSHIDVFVGQSYRFDEKTNPFPAGSGLREQDSDYVGQVSAAYEGGYGLNYRFQLDNNDFSSERHELDLYAHMGRLKLSNRYLFAKAVEGTSTDESREQVNAAAAYQVNNHWRVQGATLYDLGDDPGMRKAMLGADYTGCCFAFGVRAQKSLTADASGDGGTDIMFRIGLKNIGEFASSGDSFGMFSTGYE